jgi:predicted nucleic acid-binding protein
VTAGDTRPVVVDTMVVSALIHASRQPEPARLYRALIAGRRIVVSFATVTELRYGAIKAGWSELRRRGLERDLSRFVVVQPDDELISGCARLRAACEAAGLGLGQKIHESDRWIAATALRLEVELVSDDSVFRDVPGLAVITSGA